MAQPETDADVIVIGMGPGGEYAAGALAEAGLTVVGVDANLVGGECPNWGCIPSKMMIRAAGTLAEGRRIGEFAGTATVTPDWAPVARRIREATGDWDDAVAAERFTSKGGILVRGHGKITAPGEVTVTAPGRPHPAGSGPAGGETWLLRARRAIVINTGTEPLVPPVPGLAGTPFWTNREAIETTRVPESMVVLGGGAIGAELAQAFARFGSRVTIVEGSEHLVPAEEPEAGALLAEVFGREGIEVRTGHRAEHVEHSPGTGFTVTLSGGALLTAEALLVATGRHSNLAAVGVGAVGIEESQRSIPVDRRLRAAPGVWAIGDITGKGGFTHISMYQGGIAVADILGQDPHDAEYHAVPRVTFTDPEIGSVGLTEVQATNVGIATQVSLIPSPASSRGWIHKADEMIKLVANTEGVLVGATAVGPAGGEVLGALTVAVHARIPVTELRRMIWAFPAFHRALDPALAGLPSPG